MAGKERRALVGGPCAVMRLFCFFGCSPPTRQQDETAARRRLIGSGMRRTRRPQKTNRDDAARGGIMLVVLMLVLRRRCCVVVIRRGGTMPHDHGVFGPPLLLLGGRASPRARRVSCGVAEEGQLRITRLEAREDRRRRNNQQQQEEVDGCHDRRGLETRRVLLPTAAHHVACDATVPSAAGAPHRRSNASSRCSTVLIAAAKARS